MLKAVIFDMDGVLVDTEATYDSHLTGYLKKEFNLDINKDFLDTTRGLSSRSFWEKIFNEFNLTHSIEEVIQHARLTYFEFLKSHPDLKPIDGVIDLINSLEKSGLLLAVASSASLRRIRMILESLGIQDKFKAIICGDDVEKGKPHPDIYLKAAERLGINPKDCIAIEDATNGIKSAKAAGMKVIAYRDPKHNVQDLSKADLIIKSFAGLDLSKLKKLSTP